MSALDLQPRRRLARHLSERGWGLLGPLACSAFDDTCAPLVLKRRSPSRLGCRAHAEDEVPVAHAEHP
eukprot:13737109-Alexandrium_andersonii.AAC.1